VQLRVPRFLVGVDPQAEQTVSDRITGGRTFPAVPLRQVVRQPPGPVEVVAREVVVEVQLVPAEVQISGT
jgi:hypothetical protein